MYYDICANDAENKESLWSTLRNHNGIIKLPWIICWDFNNILDDSERIVGQTFFNAEMSALKDVWMILLCKNEN